MSFDDTERTVIRPRPGGRPGAPEQGPAAPAGPALPGAPLLDTGVNPLVAAAAPLLGLAGRLRGGTAPGDIQGLHARVAGEVKAFEQKAAAAGVEPENIRAARYALCATIDDLVLNTPWGAHSLWSTHSMVGTFHKETYGGERFFDLLERAQQDPGHRGDVLELMYLCLSLGFEGRLRIAGRGPAEHTRVREGVFRSIRTRRGDFERELSPAWRGLEGGHRPLGSVVPVWVIAAGCAVLLTAMYASYSFALNAASDAVASRFEGLPPAGAVVIERATPAAPPPEPVAVADDRADRLRTFLQPEIEQGLVTVLDDPQSITVRIAGRGMFGSGSDEIQSGFLPLLDRIGEAVEDEPGQVLVTGHSDNQPIRTIRFPSNWHLSQARAEAVERVIAGHLSDPSRATAEGRSDAEPIVSNDTAEGREQNRRIEVVLSKTASSPAAPPSAATAAPG